MKIVSSVTPTDAYYLPSTVLVVPSVETLSGLGPQYACMALWTYVLDDGTDYTPAMLGIS